MLAPTQRIPPVSFVVPVDSLQQQLQHSLGTAYILERELGGGGMSRVFVAAETALGRRVVVKLLAPQLAEGISVERFAREIRLAASLQQANIVPVLSAGEVHGLPYYTMPYVEGESLRRRLGQGALPVGEALGVLRDVAKALAYAHARGVVHRDIKPDNVLLSGGTAVVTDFGIAKALGAARTNGDGAAATGGALTALGSTLGTPAYMAPEQAAGDPDADHRLDLYAFGCLAYELLAGVAPFHGMSPQRLFAAHLTERPRALRELRPDAPPELAELVMRCLEKEPAARPASAREVVAVLDGISASGRTGTIPAALLGAVRLRKALAVYAGAFVVVALLAKAATVALDVPDWVFPAALVLMAVGLPIVLLTAWVQRVAMHEATRTPTLTPGGTRTAQGTMASMALKAAPVVNWRRTRRLGVAAAALFLLAVGAVMALRTLGVGPAASLFAAGTIDAKVPLLVADFRAVGDTSLGTVMADAVRSDLAQSKAITLLGADRVADALRRMEQNPAAKLDLPLAREVAAREGVAAIVDGEVRQIGTSYLLTLRLVRADSATELAAYRATAADAGALVETLGRLTRKLRGRVGESLHEVRASRPLDAVTTRSLDALRKYSAAVRARANGDTRLAVQLLEEAVAADTGFASAYARIGMYLAPGRGDFDRAARMLDAAYARRERLTPAERLAVEASHAWFVRDDAEAARRATQQLLELRPDDPEALHSLANAEIFAGNAARAESLYRQVIAIAPTWGTQAYGNLSRVLMVTRGDAASYDSVFAARRRAMPALPNAWAERVDSALHRRDYLGWERRLHEYCDRPGAHTPQEEIACSGRLAIVATVRGHFRGRADAAARRTPPPALADTARGRVLRTMNVPTQRAWITGDRAPLGRLLDSVQRAGALDRLPERNRPYEHLVWVSFVAGRAADARRHLAAFERQWAHAKGLEVEAQRHWLRGVVALAEGRARDAVPDFQAAEASRCVACSVTGFQIQMVATPMLAYAQDLAGDERGAEASYDRFLARADFGNGGDAQFVAGAYKRVGELAEARGDVGKAIAAYQKFVDLWSDADPELQPSVQEVRARLARLHAQESRAR